MEEGFKFGSRHVAEGVHQVGPKAVSTEDGGYVRHLPYKRSQHSRDGGVVVLKMLAGYVSGR